MKPDTPKFTLPKFADMFTNEKESKKAGKANYKKYKHTNLYKGTSKGRALDVKKAN